MDPTRFRELSDRLEYELGPHHYLEEWLRVECPICGKETTRIVTNYSNTYYCHRKSGTNVETNCPSERGTETIPDPLLHMPHEGKSVISLVEGLW